MIDRTPVGGDDGAVPRRLRARSRTRLHRQARTGPAAGRTPPDDAGVDEVEEPFYCPECWEREFGDA